MGQDGTEIASYLLGVPSSLFLLGVCAIGGAVSAAYFFFFNAKENRRLADVVGPVVVSLCVPVLVNILDRDLLVSALTTSDEQPISLAILLGLSIIVSFNSKFLVVRMLSFVDKAAADLLKQGAFEDLARRFSDMDAAVNRLQRTNKYRVEEDADVDASEGSMDIPETIQTRLSQLGASEQKILEQFIESSVEFRSLSGLSIAANLSTDDARRALVNLVQAELVEEVPPELFGGVRWAIRPIVESVMRGAESATN